MRLAVQIISWIMVVVGSIAVIGLLAQVNQGVSGSGAGLVLGVIWIVQSVLVLVYVNNNKEQ